MKDDLQTEEGRANRVKSEFELEPKISHGILKYNVLASNEFEALGQMNYLSGY